LTQIDAAQAAPAWSAKLIGIHEEADKQTVPELVRFSKALKSASK
jgi:hypothetical protein